MALEPNDFKFIQQLLHKQAAISLDSDKGYLVENRLSRVISEWGLPSIEDLIGDLRRNGDSRLQTCVVEAMTTHETSWFRDEQMFASLRETILPQLIRARQKELHLRFYSLACSTGQEPYSLAMLLSEHFPELRSWKVEIIATDLSHQIIEKASTGRFTQLEMSRGLPYGYLQKYFVKNGAECHVGPVLRKMVSFRQMNLVQPWSLTERADLVLLRNVLIYFDKNSKKDIFRRMRTVIKDDGFLVLGGAESIIVESAYQRVMIGGYPFYQLSPQSEPDIIKFKRSFRPKSMSTQIRRK